MVAGMAISNLVEPTDKAMKFDLEGFETEEAEWYLGLTRIDDKIGSIKDLRGLAPEKGKIREPRVKPKVEKINRPSPTIQRQRSKIVAIEEVSDDDLDM